MKFLVISWFLIGWIVGFFLLIDQVKKSKECNIGNLISWIVDIFLGYIILIMIIYLFIWVKCENFKFFKKVVFRRD